MSIYISFLLFPTSLLLAITGATFAIRHGTTLSLIPLAVTLVSFLVVIVAERFIPRVGRPSESGELKVDLGFAGLSAVVDAIVNPMLAGAVVLLAALLPTNLLSGLPLWAGSIGVLLVGGLGDYWAHRYAHEWRWWWKLHSVHHSPHRMVATNNFRLHPIDLALKLAFAMVPVLMLGFSTEALAMAGAMKGLNIAFQHADIDLRHGFLNYIISTNSVHRRHHSAIPAEANANYSGILSLFDLIFRSYRVPAEHLNPQRIGLFK
ncbi:MAG: sterol desaturase family protein [Kofleriaceae bacterium]|nr:sterol desaturase family protein [Kofleriaceae bacterium]